MRESLNQIHEQKMKITKTIIPAAIVAVGTTSMASAAVTYFNLGGPDTDPATTTIANGIYAGTWHNVVGVGTTNVGITTSVAPVTADGFTVSWVGGRNPADVAGPNYGGSSDLDAVSQQILWGTGAGSTQPVITIVGLSDSTQYNMTVFSGNNNAAVDYTLDAQAGGTGGTNINQVIDSDAEWASGTPFTGSLTTGTGAGSDTITLTTSAGNATPWGIGIEAVSVPEPSSTALLGLGGLALILRRRK